MASIPYRGKVVADVQLTGGIVDQVDMHIWAAVKAAGVAQGLLVEMQAEVLLGFTTSLVFSKLPVASAVFDKAFLFIYFHIYIYIYI